MVAMDDTFCEEAVERVSGYEIRIVCAEDSPESRRSTEERGEALAAWLLNRWREQRRQQQENRN